MDAKALRALAALAALGIAALALAVHWPPRDAEFNLDDRGFVASNESIRSLDAATQALLRSFPPAENARGLYRPLTNFSHALEWPHFQTDAFGYHAVNAALYAVAVALLYAFVAGYAVSGGAALAATALFAFHPVHSEAVDSVAGRSELLALVFALAALVSWRRALYARGERTPRARLDGRFALLATLCVVAAAGSKESGIAVVGLLALELALAHRAAPERVTIGRAALDLLPFALVALAWAALRYAVLGRFSPENDGKLFAFASAAERAQTMASVYLEYVRLLVFPHVLQPDLYYVNALGVAREPSPRVVAGALALAATIAGIAAAWVRALRETPARPRGARAAVAIGASAFAAFLLPVSHVVDVTVLMGERFLFAPSAGLALALAPAIDWALGRARTREGRAAVAIAIAALCLVGAARSHARAAEWRSELRLWQSLARAVPGDARAQSSLGGVHLRRGELAAAREALERAQSIDPSDYGTRVNLANLLAAEGRSDEAIAAFEAMAAGGRVDQHVWLGLARLRARRGDLAGAHEDALRALDVHPNFSETHRVLEQIEARLEQHRRARGAAASGDD